MNKKLYTHPQSSRMPLKDMVDIIDENTDLDWEDPAYVSFTVQPDEAETRTEQLVGLLGKRWHKEPILVYSSESDESGEQFGEIPNKLFQAIKETGEPILNKARAKSIRVIYHFPAYYNEQTIVVGSTLGIFVYILNKAERIFSVAARLKVMAGLVQASNAEALSILDKVPAVWGKTSAGNAVKQLLKNPAWATFFDSKDYSGKEKAKAILSLAIPSKYESELSRKDTMNAYVDLKKFTYALFETPFLNGFAKTLPSSWVLDNPRKMHPDLETVSQELAIQVINHALRALQLDAKASVKDKLVEETTVELYERLDKELRNKHVK